MQSLELILNPRFSDTDLLGHVNHTKAMAFLEEARTPIFECFTPDLSREKWELIVAKVSVDFKGQLYYGKPIQVLTTVKKIGNSSFVLRQNILQENKICVESENVMVRFDYKSSKSWTLEERHKAFLEKYLEK